MNLNAISNLLFTVAGIITAVMSAAPQILGCTLVVATNAYNCDASWLPPSWAGGVAVLLTLGGLFARKLQPGGGLTKPVAVVTSTGAPGTVTQAQVDSGPKK